MHTSVGLVAIKDVQVGDLVQTPLGFRRVVVGCGECQLKLLGGAPRVIDAVSLDHGPGSYREVRFIAHSGVKVAPPITQASARTMLIPAMTPPIANSTDAAT